MKREPVPISSNLKDRSGSGAEKGPRRRKICENSGGVNPHKSKQPMELPPMIEKVENPMGISLKAALLLLKEMNQSPAPPSVESMALLLDNVLHFGWLVRAVHERAELADSFPDSADYISDELRAYDDWASQNLF